jgi:superfamily II DNA or RNA helicase
MPITVAVGGAVFISPSDHEAMAKVKQALSFSNPDYEYAMEKRSRGGWFGKMPDKHIHAGCEIPPPHAWAGGWAAPRCFDVSSVYDGGVKIAYRMTETEEAKAEKLVLSGLKLRDYQESAVNVFSALSTGYVVAPCGSGKTSIGIGALAAVDTKALVLVHTKDLMEQWATRIAGDEDGLKPPGLVEASSGKPPSVTMYGDGKKDISGRIVIATFQSLARMPFWDRYELGRKFGLVVADECHLVPAATFSDVMACMPARFRLGLTATPERSDDLSVVLDFTFGARISEISLKELVDRRVVMLPKAVFLETGFSSSELAMDDDDGWGSSKKKELSWSKYVNSLSSDPGRRSVIIDTAMALVRSGRQTLVLCERVESCHELAAEMSKLGVRAEAITGGVSKKVRKSLISDAENGAIDIIVATQLADIGLDLPGLGAAILTTPTKQTGRLQQRVGRIMRYKNGKKTPILVDLLDEDGVARAMARKRGKFFKSIGCDIVVAKTTEEVVTAA